MDDRAESESCTVEEVSWATISHQTASKLPLLLPWHPQQFVRLGTLFHSNRPYDPWAKDSPFDTYSLLSTPVIVQREDGTESLFNSHSTSHSSETKDHMSLGLGVGAGLPFLAEVSVTGTYDQDVIENNDACKTSIRSTLRAGSVQFSRQPRLTTEAIITIKYHGGLPAFQARYGDYYVAGYKLGGDTGLLISGSQESKTKLERFGITVRVEVLFIGASTTHTKDITTSTARSSLRLMGYDTLDHQSWRSSQAEKPGFDASAFGAQVAGIVSQSQSLDSRVAEKLDNLGIQDGDHLNSDDCRKLIESGLVAELVLLPVGTLREVIEWVIEDDII